MLWEVEIQPKGADVERDRVAREYELLTHHQQELVARSARGYLLEGRLTVEQVQRLADELLVDRLAENGAIHSLPNGLKEPAWTVLLKPGVMDPVAQSVLDAARDLGITLESVRTFRRYYLVESAIRNPQWRRVLANDAIEQIVEGPLSAAHLELCKPYAFRKVEVPIRHLDDASLLKLSQEGQLALDLAEMQAIQAHYRGLGREPTDVELETLAQTWSEHCSHKTLKGPIDYFESDRSVGPTSPSVGPSSPSVGPSRRINNLLKETIFAATQEIRRRYGKEDWCVSVFEDNAGVVQFDDRYHVCIKVETHNHPSAIEPYGGANTGLGGVIRDPLGTALGAQPICNTDVFCFAPPDTPPETLPPGVLHPVKVIKGVVAGVRDYGNRMGIPTVNGAVLFDDRYLGNPLVFCGTVGLIPVERARKEVKPGDLIVVVGGRTGRDGIHGATFSSLELTSKSEQVSGGAVQIGNAITEKKMLDVILQARDQGLYHAITDCGAGGLSSAVGEMGAKIGAQVHLEKVPLKYAGLSYTEIWISEAQERMVLAVPPESWDALQRLFAGEDVEATVIGRFEPGGRLKLFYQGNAVADLDMKFLHEGRPQVARQAIAPVRDASQKREPPRRFSLASLTDVLLKILSSYSVCGKEWIIRQYDHEVQGATVIKPLVGMHDDGPSDAAVIHPLRVPIPGSPLTPRPAPLAHTGLAIGCGINPRYGDLDPYWMAAACIDEAVRNVVAVGADPGRIALLDNFCWGNTARPEVLGALVRAAEACRDVALAYNTPFISGKDSLNNEFHAQDRHIVIPPTLLITALGRVPDVRRCVTMDLKEPGNFLYLIGETRDELGGSHFHLATGQAGGQVPRVDLDRAPLLFLELHEAIRSGLVRACHDLSEGGLAVALAEMAFAGGLGADVTSLKEIADLPDALRLFSESPTRWVVEVMPANVSTFEKQFADLPCYRIGQVVSEPRLRIAGQTGEWLIWSELAALKEAWQKPLRW